MDHDECLELAIARMARDVVMAKADQETFFTVVRAAANEGADHAARLLSRAWPETARWPAGEDAVQRDDEGDVDILELMELLHWRLAHLAHSAFRDEQIRELIESLPGHYPKIVINRGLDYREIPCGRPQDQVVDTAEGLRLMATTPCEHPACCCTFDPLAARDLAALGR